MHITTRANRASGTLCSAQAARPAAGASADVCLLQRSSPSSIGPHQLRPAGVLSLAHVAAPDARNPFDDEIRDLSIVFVLHDHVAITVDSCGRSVQHCGFAHC